MNDLPQQVATGNAAAAELAQTDTAFKAVEAAYIDSLLNGTRAGVAGVNDREALFQAVHVIRKVRQHLELQISNGSLAGVELARLAEAET